MPTQSRSWGFGSGEDTVRQMEKSRCRQNNPQMPLILVLWDPRSQAGVSWQVTSQPPFQRSFLPSPHSQIQDLPFLWMFSWHMGEWELVAPAAPFPSAFHACGWLKNHLCCWG